MATGFEPPGDPFDSWKDPTAGLRLCRLAFVLAAVALGLQAAVVGLDVYVRMVRDRNLQALVDSPQWDWYVGTGLTWGALIASLFLLGRRNTNGWAWRAGLLCAMNAVDLGLWFHKHAGEMGVSFALPFMSDPLAVHAISVLQWIELWLFASLGVGLVGELNRSEAADLGRAARATALVGLIMWLLQCLLMASWQFEWEGRNHRRLAEIYMLEHYSRVMLALTAFQVTAVCVLAARACRAALKAEKHSLNEPEALKSRSEPFDDRRDRWSD